MITRLFDTLRGVADVLNALEKRWALVGGLALSVYVEPRFTADIDIAVAVDDDDEAEQLLHTLQARGFVIETVIEQQATSRLATVRTYRSDDSPEGILIDLLFASSGVEPEIAQRANTVELVEGLAVPVARPADLFALKLLSVDTDDRPEDVVDLQRLAEHREELDRDEIADLLSLIEQRGYSRGRDLQGLLDEYLDG